MLRAPCHVLVDRQAPARVLGYYTLNAAQVDAKSFYEHFGFTAFSTKPLSLYLSLGK